MDNNTINAIKVNDTIYVIRDNRVENKVDKVEGERLMTDAEGAKLAGIAEGAQVNVIEGVAEGEQVIELDSDKKIKTNLSISYDSDAKEIKLMSGNVQVGDAINATDFIKDGMVSNAELVAGEGEDEGKMFIEITFNSDAESDPIRIEVSSLVDAGAITDLEELVKTNKEAIDAIETAMGNWSVEEQKGIDARQNKTIEDGDAATLKSAKEYADANVASVKEYADAEIKKVTDAQVLVDTAQDDRLDEIEGILEEKSSIWDSAEQNAKDFADRRISALDGSRPLLLDDKFNLNYYTSQGIYYFRGERINSNDNLPIMNAASGHSISGQLTVLDASLSDEEQCITQYLKLSNRLGREGKEYVRTYNLFKDGREEWSPWRELKQTTNLNQISDEDLKNYTENGVYEGAIFNVNDIENPPSVIAKFLADISTADGAMAIPSGSLFSMQVLNNYAVTQKAEQMGLRIPQSIVQIAKVLLVNSQFAEVVRTYNSESNNWSNWKISSVIIGA